MFQPILINAGKFLGISDDARLVLSSGINVEHSIELGTRKFDALSRINVVLATEKEICFRRFTKLSHLIETLEMSRSIPYLEHLRRRNLR